MSSLSRELVFLILQFLDEEKFKDTVHRLEKESGFFFNMRYFEDSVTNGEWDDVETYLSGFTKVDDNRYSMKIFFEIRKQKYLEALDRREHPKAVEILMKDLKVFSTFNEDLFKEITMLLTLTNFRENEQLSKYGDTKSARAIMLVELKKLIEANPLFRDKLQFPTFKNSRLRTLINQSLNWQHQLCKNQRPNPDIKTLFVDHSCGQPNGARAPSPVTNPLANVMAKVGGGFPALGAHGPFQPVPAGFTAPLAGWMANPSSVPHQTVSVGTSHPMSLGAPSNAAMVKRPRTATDNPAVDYQTADSDLLKRSRHLSIGDEVNNMPLNILPTTFPGPSQTPTLYSSEDLPKTVVANLNQGSAVKSMEFHPVQNSLLLVGTNLGDVSIWEVGSKERLVYRNFKVWELTHCTVPLQASLASEYTASVNRVAWSLDGALFGVAYSKHIVHVYAYLGGTELRNHLEIDAHAGNVSDLAFAPLNKQLCIITCGEDKTIKVWDAASGSKLFTFEGHEAPVYSVCPHHKENIQFIFSTAVDGKIKAWLYDHGGSRVDYDAPGRSCTKMAYTADGTRLFSCGTNKEGESFLVEWNESEGAVKRSYMGLGKRSVGVVQFDTTRNKYLAAGDEFGIKFWDMDNVNLLTTIDAEGALPASPCLRFNKEGILLAVSTGDNGIKVLASTDGVRLVRSIESRMDSSRAASASSAKAPLTTIFGARASSPMVGTNIGVGERNVPLTSMNGDNRSTPDVKPNIEKSKAWRLTEINDPSQLRSLRLADHTLPVRIMRLMYTNSGGALLALSYNATHKLWKWQRNERNVTGKATSAAAPQLWTPPSGVLMTNEIGSANPEDVVPCFALSKNDSYVMSASGGKISLFNMMTFKTMTTFMPPPPAATSLAFHPEDNNIIAIGMDDSTIHIYNVRVDEVSSKLKGHQKRVTGLAFSNVLNVLVSSGADSQLCVWSIEGWEKQVSKFLQMPTGRSASPNAQTRVLFQQDQVHMLVVHETQVAIYEAPKLECIKQQWSPRESGSAITDAVYSCDSQTVFVSSDDGSVSVLVASTLALRCTINSVAYLPSNPRTFPVSIAAHPSEPNQFAVGLSDGWVQVLEPTESEAKWGIPPPSENGAGPSVSSATAASDQPSR
ncbi:topless-related protein 4-like isoform X3 [Silene latifolia]|uniref:topless-related protein 4-like isoform X3 n=1 Tax=Silene latifolia TaxID=37657 RepID=UPI003D787211